MNKAKQNEKPLFSLGTRPEEFLVSRDAFATTSSTFTHD